MAEDDNRTAQRGRNDDGGGVEIWVQTEMPTWFEEKNSKFLDESSLRACVVLYSDGHGSDMPFKLSQKRGGSGNPAGTMYGIMFFVIPPEFSRDWMTGVSHGFKDKDVLIKSGWIVGAAGTGKSYTLLRLLDEVRSRRPGDSVFFFGNRNDVSFWRRDRDLLLDAVSGSSLSANTLGSLAASWSHGILPPSFGAFLTWGDDDFSQAIACESWCFLLRKLEDRIERDRIEKNDNYLHIVCDDSVSRKAYASTMRFISQHHYRKTNLSFWMTAQYAEDMFLDEQGHDYAEPEAKLIKAWFSKAGIRIVKNPGHSSCSEKSRRLLEEVGALVAPEKPLLKFESLCSLQGRKWEFSNMKNGLPAIPGIST